MEDSKAISPHSSWPLSNCKDRKLKKACKSSNSQPTTQVIFKAKVVNPGDHKVKVEFEMAKERLHMYQDGKHKSSSDFGEATHPARGSIKPLRERKMREAM